MAYNLQPLVQILEQILHPDHHDRWILAPNKRSQLESLLEKANFLKELFDNSSPLTGDKIESLEWRITDAVHEAEDVLESHLVEQILSVHEGVSFTISPPDLQKAIGEFDAAKEEMKKIMDGSQIVASSLPSNSSRHDPNPKNIVVGIGKDLNQLKYRLTGEQPSKELEILPIVGMGGIGKTTLARNVYDDPLVVSHFDIRAWITISQDYDTRGILVGLLGCVHVLTDEMLKEENAQLEVRLHKTLSRRRFLIVLDDMWSTTAWDDTRRFFPDDKNASRVIVTTRELSVANYAGSNGSHHQMKLLDPVESWNLLHQKVFAQETCPLDLEKIGKKIANNCRGLPLAIHVIGGILSQTRRTKESWVQIANDVSSVVASQDEQFSKILSLSYSHLPNHLKPCFLYMGAFPEDYEIPASKLVRLWVAEGFLKPISGKTLEEAAQVYLKALVDRNLLFVRKQYTYGNVKSYIIHDLLRDLCVSKAHQEKLLYIKNQQVYNLPQDTICLRRVSAHSSYRIRDIYDSVELMMLARTFLFIGSASQGGLSRVIFGLRLLRVLDVLGIQFLEFPKEMLQLVNLRYLALSCQDENAPSSISTLWNLQTLILRCQSIREMYKLLDMPRLRHIKLNVGSQAYFSLPYGKSFLQENLQNLSTICIDYELLDRIFESIPNLKKLGISKRHLVGHPNINLTCLHKLETLKCSDLYPKSSIFLSTLILPPSLKKLTFSYCTIPLGFMNKIGYLPNLEVLKLRNCTFKNSTWEPTEGEFCQLQFLLLEHFYLENWQADDTHFPRLQWLVIRDCSEFKEIPCGIGDIPTLEKIEVHKCSPSIVASARKIQEEQLDNGNDVLQVLISGSLK